MFDGAKSKIERAGHHIGELEGQLIALTQQSLDASIKYSDRDGGGIDITLTVVPPSQTIALVIGDAVHNLWSALDHLHYEAIGRDCGVQHSQLFFPKGRCRQSYEGSCGGTKEASAALKDLLKSLEVFPGGKGEVLYIVNCLDRTDKHSTLTPVVHAPNISELVIVADGVRRRLDELYGSAPTLLEGETLSIVGAIAGTTLEFNDNAKVSPHILFGDVEFVQGRPILPTIRQLRDTVADTVKTIERFFFFNAQPR